MVAFFQEHEYRIKNLFRARAIVNICANIGLTAIYFLILYPILRSYCLNPCPRSFDILRHNIARSSGIETYRLAVSDYDSEATLKIHKDNSGQNSLTLDGANFTTPETVMVTNAYSLLQEMQLTTADVLKINTEGSEFPSMRSLAPMLSQVRHKLVETHILVDRLAIESLLPTHTLAADRNHIKDLEFYFSIVKNKKGAPDA